MSFLQVLTLGGALMFILSNFAKDTQQLRWMQMFGVVSQFSGWLGIAIVDGSNSGFVFTTIFGVSIVFGLLIYFDEFKKDIRSFLVDEEAEEKEKARKEFEKKLIKDIQDSQERADNYGNNVYE